ncbi:MAG: signal recognition particle-docking protein FtsY [Thermoplasmata archaeon]
MSSAPPSGPGAERATRSSARPPGELFSEGMLGRRLREATLDDIFQDLELVLLQVDVALPVIERMEADLRKELTGRKLRWGVDAETAVRACLERSARAILNQPVIDVAAAARAQDPKPYVILFLGVNGTGKTTTVAKIAGWLRERGLSSVIAAGDTFRAGAIDQLLIHGEKLGIRVVRQQEGSDPAAVAFDAIAHARAKKVDVVLIDTAGRQNTNDNLIQEAKKIGRVAHPSLTLFVGDALSGNDVVTQAELFNQALGIDGIVLTKLDADARGGAALSVAYVVHKPIVFVGTGQGYADLAAFDPDWLVRRLFSEEGAG